eukprot:jgi/Tetstr1/466757/TSEL_011227.t1
MPREDARCVLPRHADEETAMSELLLDHNYLPIQPRIDSEDPMDDIKGMLAHTVWLDIPQVSGLTRQGITQKLATTLLDPHDEAGQGGGGGGGVEPRELEATMRDAVSAVWDDYYDDIANGAPDAEVCLPPTALLALLEIKFISKAKPRATSA